MNILKSLHLINIMQKHKTMSSNFRPAGQVRAIHENPYLYHPYPEKPVMETKVLMLIFGLVGVPAGVLALILNIGTWKADILWGIAVLFNLVWMVFFAIRQIDGMKMRKIERDKARRNWNGPNWK
jgi:hypothetical protein